MRHECALDGNGKSNTSFQTNSEKVDINSRKEGDQTGGGQRKWDTVLPIFLIILGIVSGLYLRSGGCDSEAVENPYNSKSPGWPRPVLL